MARNRQWLFAAMLVGVSAFSSAAFACVTPFAAFAVVAVYALSMRAALLTVSAIWLANQLIGFAILGYPWTMDTALWGLSIGSAALLAAVLARAAMRLANENAAAAVAAAIVVAFGAYEASLFLVTFALGGQEAFTPAIVGYLALLNLGWTAALVGTSEVLRRAGTMGPSVAGAGTRMAL